MILSRRALLAAPLVCAAASAGRPPRLAALVTEWRDNSHADVIVRKFLEGCRVLDVDYQPRVRIASLYLDQTPANDLGVELARKHGVPVYPTIREALTLGGERLAVDGVLSIAEHGRYPYNELGQLMYPRRRFFDEAVAVIRESGKPVPFFNDKHLGFAWADAKHMVDTARSLKMPLMAGSSLPVAWRRPETSFPSGAQVAEVVVAAYGPTEGYGFHALETLQCMVEHRRGGETGVRSVRYLAAPELWLAGDRGEWSWDLLRAALARSENPTAAGADRQVVRARTQDAEGFLIEYRDGLRAAVLMLHGLLQEFLFAARLPDRADPLSTLFWLQEGKPFGHFARLCAAMEPMFLGMPPTQPVERTLLTTGVLDRVMQSRHRKGERLATPELEFAYRPVRSR